MTSLTGTEYPFMMIGRPVKILLVDNNKAFITHASLLLRKMAFTKVVIAEDGVEALKLIKLWLPDVILLNVNMPNMNGATTLRHIREDKDTARLPVIMLTSDMRQKSVAECREMGCTGVLQKPLDFASLHHAIQDCVTSAGSNRRINIRSRYEKKVGVIHSGATEVVESLSLSEGGLSVKSEPLPVGSQVEIILPIRDKLPLHLKGKVIYHTGPSADMPSAPRGMAVVFLDVTEETSLLLRGYIADMITGKYPQT